MLRIQTLSAFYGNIQALRGISLHVDDGEIVTLLGANGAGKTTLLNAICGLITSRKGDITFHNEDITGLSAEKIVKLGISQVPEGRQLFDALTVLDNLILGSYHHLSGRRVRSNQISGRRVRSNQISGRRVRSNQNLVSRVAECEAIKSTSSKNKYRNSKKEIYRYLDTIFEIFPILKEREKQYAGTLSGGEQQMLAVGRALMSRPTLLLLDEPSMGLAPKIVNEIFEVIKHLRDEQNTTILLVEQNAHVALDVADRGYILETGRIVLQGTSEELLENKEIKRAYLGKGYKEVWE